MHKKKPLNMGGFTFKYGRLFHITLIRQIPFAHDISIGYTNKGNPMNFPVILKSTYILWHPPSILSHFNLENY